jgi:hypothetical protein
MAHLWVVTFFDVKMFNFQYLHNYSCPRIQSLPATIREDWLNLSSVKILASSHHQSEFMNFFIGKWLVKLQGHSYSFVQTSQIWS